MKKRFRYLAIQDAKREGSFGHYLASPVTDRTRTLIISERLSFLRQQAELSQRDVCEIIGIAVTTYSGYEQGKHEPSAEIVCRLASLYKVSADFILGVGFHDPYSEEIMEHFAYSTNDIDMAHLRESMDDVAVEEHEYETGIAKYCILDETDE